MSNISSETPLFGDTTILRTLPPRTSIEVNGVTNAAVVALGLREEGNPFELPARLFEQLPFAVYVCDREGLVSDTTAALPNYGAGRLRLAIPMNDFADRIECTAPTAVCFPHHQCPMADVLRTGALVDIEALRDGAGNIVGAVNCFQDITSGCDPLV
jgi:hypothetical protein